MDPMRLEDITKTIESLNSLLKSSAIDLVTRKHTQEVKRMLERELEVLEPGE
jgi:hypothetical protein